tara:strand:- start:76471 stop:76989 length:519 start_codon:yes stop_codon:yes gene_type:complete
MRETTVKISVTQDGLLPEEVTLLGKIFLPAIQKQILKSTGFEKIDDSTFAGVVPIKITTNSKIQEIEFEVGAIPDFRKKVVEFVNQVSLLEFVKEEPVIEDEKPLKKTKSASSNEKKLKAKSKKIKPKKKSTDIKKLSPKKTTAKKVSAKKKPVIKKVKKKAIPKKTKKGKK